MFNANFFDFVYSYIVFQHIPDRAVVLHYLEEARRVLKPGGILCCQLRGTPPMPTELEREPETWTGCHFSAQEMMAFSTGCGFPLVAVWGLETQYMWTVWRKPSNESGARLFARHRQGRDHLFRRRPKRSAARSATPASACGSTACPKTRA